MAAQLNIFDVSVVCILGLSMLIAFFRGFIREVLSLGAWVGAAIITIYLFPHTTELMKHHVKGELAAGIGALGTYIAALIAIFIINSVILRYVKSGSEVGLLDNFLGLVFGCLRGMFILSLGYLILSASVPKENPPPWLKTSITKHYLQTGADLLASAAPKYLSEFEALVKRGEKEVRHEQDKNNVPPAATPDMNAPVNTPPQPQGVSIPSVQ